MDISPGTNSFVEYLLRREMDLIVGFATRPDPGHLEQDLEWYVELHKTMFQPPFPSEYIPDFNPEWVEEMRKTEIRVQLVWAGIRKF